MGTDIHWAIEYRGKAGQQWYPEAVDLPNERDYTMFALLAGVRNYGMAELPIPESRGVPVDSCQEVKTFLEVVGYHSHSWVSLEEFMEKFPNTGDTMMRYQMARLVYGYCLYPYSYHYRIVFAFDC